MSGGSDHEGHCRESEAEHRNSEGEMVAAESIVQKSSKPWAERTTDPHPGEDHPVDGTEMFTCKKIRGTDENRWGLKPGTVTKTQRIDIKQPAVGSVVNLGQGKDREDGKQASGDEHHLTADAV